MRNSSLSSACGLSFPDLAFHVALRTAKRNLQEHLDIRPAVAVWGYSHLVCVFHLPLCGALDVCAILLNAGDTVVAASSGIIVQKHGNGARTGPWF